MYRIETALSFIGGWGTVYFLFAAISSNDALNMGYY